MNNSEGYINWDLKPDYNYVLQYLYESEVPRQQYQIMLYRTALAMAGRPWKNLYREELLGNIKKIQDKERAKRLEECLDVPEGQDFTIAKAVRNRANQMSTGVDTYECEVNDPYGLADAETVDLLSAKCTQDYTESNLNTLAEVFSRDLSLAGVTAVRVNYDVAHDRNIIERINPKNIIWDTKYSSTGQERFRGYNMMISWQKLKKMVQDNPNEQINLDISAPTNSLVHKEEGSSNKFSVYVDKQAKYKNRKIRSLNGLDVYVEDINRLATAAGLQGLAGADTWEFYHDLQQCYSLGYYQSFAVTPKGQTNSNYVGDDVELTVIFDMIKRIEYKIINRRYVISANGNSFHRIINFPAKNPIDGSIVNQFSEFELGSPLKFQFERQDLRDEAPMPISSVMNLLDLHDKLCALRAKREHVSNILSILRITTNAADAQSLEETLNLMGVVIDDMQGDVSNLQFAYDWTPIDSQIAYYENLIKEYLAGYSEFDAMQMMGDRASAAESGMAVGAVAQGLATHQNAIMELYADIARQCIGNRVVYSPRQEFGVVNEGDYSSLTIQQMALSVVKDVIPASAKRIRERTVAANALQALSTMGQRLSEAGQAKLLEMTLFGLAPRRVIQEWINPTGPDPQLVQLAEQDGANMAQALAQNAQMYQDNPIPYEAQNVMQTNTPDQVDDIIGQYSAEIGPEGQMTEEGSVETIDMPMQAGAMSSDIRGQTSDSGAALANPNALGESLGF